MKINYIKIENWSRITAGALLYGFAALALYGVFKGNYGHIITSIGFALMATGVLRKW